MACILKPQVSASNAVRMMEMDLTSTCAESADEYASHRSCPERTLTILTEWLGTSRSVPTADVTDQHLRSGT
jgi:hypothetical protein